MTDDQVQQVLQEIAAMWSVDDDPIRWLDPGVDGAPGFDWWPGDFCVRIRAHRHVDPAIDPSVRIAIDTDLLKAVNLESEGFQTKVELLARVDTSTFAWVYVPKPVWDMADDPTLETKLRLSNTAHVTPESTGWVPRLLAYAAISQPIYAQSEARVLAELLGSGIPEATRPHALEHARLRARFAAIADGFAESGKATSSFAGTGEFEAVVSTWPRQEGFFGHADQTRMLLRAPFGEDSVLIQFLTEETHEKLGHGLAVTLRLPLSGDRLSAVNESAYLNFMESRSWTGFPFLGCWQTWRDGEQYGPEFILFVPNALYLPGLVSHVAYWFMGRAGWLRMLKSSEGADEPTREVPNPRRH